jgi:hypothetical protein
MVKSTEAVDKLVGLAAGTDIQLPPDSIEETQHPDETCEFPTIAKVRPVRV